MAAAKSSLAIDLRCERFAEPLGVETLQPALSWRLAGNARGLRQGAYRILVASSPQRLAADEGDLWDSGKISSDQCLYVPYGGKPLRSRQRCWWKVAVWDGQGEGGGFSDVAHWEMGLLSQDDWKGNWISAGEAFPMKDQLDGSAPHFRRTLTLRDKPVAARMYICGLGYHELYINGQRIGDAVLEPAFTRYDARALYVVHDVTAQLSAGENAIGVILGTGMYDCLTKEVWEFVTAPWRDRPKLRCQLHVELADRSELVLCSDRQWKCAMGPITFNALRNGEFYDARRELGGWASPGLNDAAWKPVTIIPAPGGQLRWQKMPPCRVTATIKPIAITQPREGVFIVDMGQAFAGWARIRPRGPAGATVRLRYAEKLTSDGELDQSNLNCFVKSGEFQTDRYTLKGEAGECWEPRFTYHGFRWVEITGWPGVPTVDDIDGRVVHTAFDSAGTFECSNELVNKIQRAARWSTVGNYHGIPTDCPHREKCGWTGDAMVSAEQVLLNFDVASSYAKWMDDLSDAQRPSGQLPGIVPSAGWGYNWGSGPAWDSAITHIPWYVYLYTGDASLLSARYDDMKRYLRFMDSMANGHILHFGLGDWVPPGPDPSGHPCPTAMTSTGYYYANACILAQAAEILGKPEEAAAFAQQARQIREAMLETFFDKRARRSVCNSQTGNGALLFYDLLDEPDRSHVLAALVADIFGRDLHGHFGILGAKYVLQALTDAGRADVAYRVATQDTYPSWGWWFRQGATTLWEMWEGGTSRLHHMFSDISGWFYKALAGISPDPQAPGFKRARIRPNFVPGLEWVRAEHRSGYGVLGVSWRRVDGGVELQLRVPANTTAELTLPAGFVVDGGTVLDVESGDHTLVVRESPAAQPHATLRVSVPVTTR